MPIYPNNRDIRYFREINNEVFSRFFVPKKYYPLDLTQKKDDFYNETDVPVYLEAHLVHTYVDRQPRQEVLDRFGIHEERDLVLIFSRDQMDHKGIVPKAGDVVVIEDSENLEDREYEIQVARPGDWFGNTGLPFHWVCPADIKEGSSVDDNRADPGVNEPADDFY